jgi:hypothetical protein
MLQTFMVTSFSFFLLLQSTSYIREHASINMGKKSKAWVVTYQDDKGEVLVDVDRHHRRRTAPRPCLVYWHQDVVLDSVA